MKPLNKSIFPKANIKGFLKECLTLQSKRGEFELILRDGHTEFSFRIYRNILADQSTTAFYPRGTPMDPIEEKKHGKFTTRKITTSEFTVFLEMLLKERIWDLVNCKQSGLPDEGDLTFLILQKGTPIFEQTVWESCKNEDPRTAALLKHILSITPEPQS